MKSPTAPEPPPKRRRGGNPPWQPSEQDRRLVEAMHATGVPETLIAEVLKISRATLLKHCRHELDVGMAKANTAVAQFLFAGIVGTATRPPFADERNRLTGAIFWLKCRAGWRETVSHEVIRRIDDMSDEEVAARLAIENPNSEANVVSFPRRR